MPWNTCPARAARNEAGTEIRPLRSIRLMKVSMNRATDRPPAFRKPGLGRQRVVGTLPCDGRRRHRYAAGTMVDPPAGHGISSKVHGISWDGMGVNGNNP